MSRNTVVEEIEVHPVRYPRSLQEFKLVVYFAMAVAIVSTVWFVVSKILAEVVMVSAVMLIIVCVWGTASLWLDLISKYRRSRVIASPHPQVIYIQQDGSVLNISAENNRAVAEGNMYGKLNAAQILRALNSGQSTAATTVTEVSALALPSRAVPWSQMHHLVTAEQEVFGWDGKQWVTGHADYSLSMGIIGEPRYGKTTLLRYRMACALKRGAIVIGWDHHSDVVQDPSRFDRSRVDIRDDPGGILESAEYLICELDNRARMRKELGKEEFNQTVPELLHFADEFNNLLMWIEANFPGKEGEQKITRVKMAMQRLILEGPKYKMRSTLLGHGLPADMFKQSAVRDALNTKYAFSTTANQARMLGFSEEVITELLPLLKGPVEECRGYALMSGGPLRDAALISVPQTTEEDLYGLCTLPLVSPVHTIRTTDPLEYSEVNYDNTVLEWWYTMTEKTEECYAHMVKMDALNYYVEWCSKFKKRTETPAMFYRITMSEMESLGIVESTPYIASIPDGPRDKKIYVYVGRKYVLEPEYH